MMVAVVLSPTASSVDFNARDDYFFRLIGSNDNQGRLLAEEAAAAPMPLIGRNGSRPFPRGRPANQIEAGPTSSGLAATPFIYLFCPSEDKKLLALNAVVLAWSDGKTCIPLTFRSLPGSLPRSTGKEWRRSSGDGWRFFPLVQTGLSDLIHERKVGTEIFVSIATLAAVCGGETVAGTVLMVIILIAEFILTENSPQVRC